MTSAYHEPVSELSNEAREIHRAIASTIEELEAVNWYNQRADVTGDSDLEAILRHNRDEEIEHAAMALEWLRRRIPKLDEQLRTYLFTSDPITQIEENDSSARDTGADDGASPEAAEAATGDLGIRRAVARPVS